MNLSLIIPVYNEEENLPLLYTSIDQALAPLKDTWEVIFAPTACANTGMKRCISP